MLDTYFDRLYLINLERRTDRLEETLKEYSGVGISSFQVMKAIDGKAENVAFTNPYNLSIYQWNQPSAGLVATTIEIIKDAKAKGYRHICINEDDIEFHPQFNEVFSKYISKIPDDWEMIQMGSCHQEPVKILQRHLGRIRQASALHCYAVRDTIYDLYLEHLEKMDRQIDLITRQEIQTRDKCYAFVPNITFQKAGWSDLNERFLNPCFLRNY